MATDPESKEQKVRLHLGCGGRIYPDWTNVDYHNPRADMKVDLFSFPWPWKDSSVDEILMEQFLEHFPNLIDAVREVHRVLKPGGTFRAVVPHSRSINAYAIGHVTMFSRVTFAQLSDNSDWFSQAYGCRFQPLQYRVRILKLGRLRWTPFDWAASRWPYFWEKASFSLLSPTEIEWTGKALK